MPSCGNAETARALGARFASELFNPQRAVQTLSSKNKVGGGRICRHQVDIYIYGMGASLSYFLHTFESHDSQLLKFCDSTVSSCDTLMPFPVRFLGVGLVGELFIAGLGWCHTTPVTLMIP